MFSFSRPQHGLHGVVVGFVPLLWLAKMITLQSVLLLLKTVVRNCFDSFAADNYYAPGGRYVVYTDTGKPKFILTEIKLRHQTDALGAVEFKLFNSLGSKS